MGVGADSSSSEMAREGGGEEGKGSQANIRSRPGAKRRGEGRLCHNPGDPSSEAT